LKLIQNRFYFANLKSAIEHSLIIINCISVNNYIDVSFSGGKDSCVLVELCKMAGVDYELHYAQVGIDPPELIKFMKRNYPETIFHKPAASFYKLIEKKGFPTRISKWCCDEIKKKPLHNASEIMITGLRASESSGRKDRGSIYHYKKQTVVNPILYWNEADVWEFIQERNIKLCDLYKIQDRIGCVVCPSKGRNIIKEMNEHPNMFKAMLKKSLEYVKCHNGEKFDVYAIIRIMYQLDKHEIPYKLKGMIKKMERQKMEGHIDGL